MDVLALEVLDVGEPQAEIDHPELAAVGEALRAATQRPEDGEAGVAHSSCTSSRDDVTLMPFVLMIAKS